MLQILPFRFWGGPEIQTFQLAAQLKKESGANTDLILYVSPQSTESDQKLVQQKALEYNLTVILRPSPFLLNIFSERRFLAKTLREHNIDLAVSTGYLCDLLLVGQKIKKISIVHGWTAQNLKVRIYEALDRFLLNFFDTIACVSLQQKQKIKNLGLQAHLLSNSLDLDKKMTKPLAKDSLLKTLNLAGSVKLFLSVGRLSAEKGHAFAIQSFAKTAFEKNNLHWIFIGDGPELLSLQKLTTNLNLSSRIHFIGKIDHARSYMSAVDFFILPSRREGLPVVLLEAFAESCPVIATEVGGNGELVLHKKTGLLTQYNDSHDLADQLTWAIAHPEKMSEYATQAKAHLKNNFSLQKQTEQWQEIIRYALSR